MQRAGRVDAVQQIHRQFGAEHGAVLSRVPQHLLIGLHRHRRSQIVNKHNFVIRLLDALSIIESMLGHI